METEEIKFKSWLREEPGRPYSWLLSQRPRRSTELSVLFSNTLCELLACVSYCDRPRQTIKPWTMSPVSCTHEDSAIRRWVSDFIRRKEPILWSWAACPIPPHEPHTSHKRKENRTDIRLDLPEGLCCNVLHHWKKILHHQIRTIAAQLIEMLQANFHLSS